MCCTVINTNVRYKKRRGEYQKRLRPSLCATILSLLLLLLLLPIKVSMFRDKNAHDVQEAAFNLDFVLGQIQNLSYPHHIIIIIMNEEKIRFI